MTCRPQDARQAALAVLTALAMLVVATAAMAPGHWHRGQQERPCDICRGGQLPVIQSPVGIELQAPAVVEWRWPCAAFAPLVEPVVDPGSPRAPPA